MRRGVLMHIFLLFVKRFVLVSLKISRVVFIMVLPLHSMQERKGLKRFRRRVGMQFLKLHAENTLFLKRWCDFEIMQMVLFIDKNLCTCICKYVCKNAVCVCDQTCI